MHKLYLTANERSVFEKLPETIREGWEVEEETGTAYEDDEVLNIRAGMARFQGYPELKAAVVKAVQDKKIPDAALFDSVSEEVLPELYFTIGARGMSVLIGVLLGAVKNDEDLEGITGFSNVRHDILETNASISYS